MDWVDYKRLVRRYRLAYVDLYSYVVFILQGTLQSYARYMTIRRSGAEEWKAIRQYGLFLYHYAELQNLTIDYITEQRNTDHYDWSMVENGITIARDYESGSLDDTEMMNNVANWARMWFPFIMVQDHFYEGMQDFRVHIKEIWHDKNGI